MNLLSLFSGIGGIDHAAHRFGIKTVAFVEWDPFCQAILKLRYPGVPVYGDIRQVTGKQLERDGIPSVDIVAGGFPCQGNSTAGKRKGKADERYLWPEMARIVREVESQWMVAENVRGIFSVDGGELFGDVIRDLAGMGHSVGWGCWGACDIGAPHQRDRVFIMAHSKSERCGEARYNWQRSQEWATSSSSISGGLMWPTPTSRDYKSGKGAKVRTGHTSPLSDVCQGQLNPDWVESLMNFPIGWTDLECVKPVEWPGWPAYRGQQQYDYEAPRIVSGMKNRPNRLKALGNAVVPLQAVPIFAAIKQIEAGA